MAQFGDLPVVLNLVVWKSHVDHTNSYIGFQLRSNTICRYRTSFGCSIDCLGPSQSVVYSSINNLCNYDDH